MERIAREAGGVIAEYFAQEHKSVSIKNGDTTDLVTETDQWVETFVRDQLRAFKPDWAFIGEESSDPDVAIPMDPVWIIDPIDGTTNFVHRLPEVGVSIGLVVGQIPVAGVVFNPIRKQMLSAVQGHGCRLNGSPLVLDTSDRPLNQCLLMTQFINYGGQRSQRFTQIDRLLDVPVHAIRFIGCATMALGYVAMGVADCYFERGLKAWDMAAAVIIIREAGGVVVDYSGADHIDLTRRECVAARNMTIAKEILDVVNSS